MLGEKPILECKLINYLDLCVILNADNPNQTAIALQLRFSIFEADTDCELFNQNWKVYI